MITLNQDRAMAAARDDQFARGSTSAGGPVVFHQCPGTAARRHEIASKSAVARAVAAFMGRDYGGDFDPTLGYAGRPYFVPSETLVATAMPTGIACDGLEDLLGGVVPQAFVATKVITHGLLGRAADAPPGWSHAFADRVADSVLPGFTAFNRSDALRAGELLLADGPVRLKQPDGVGGRGQQVVGDGRELAAAIDAMERATLEREGIVLERDLDEVTTASIGRVCIGDFVVTYCGTQSLTRAHDGSRVYGGSRLLVARGDWDRLLALPCLPPGMDTAIAQARRYHDAAHHCYDGLYASRSNYDVAQGIDRATGARRSGVLEQSWRIGGASGAELVAMMALRSDPGLAAVSAETVERYGEEHQPPPGALVLFRGTDPTCGPLLKYARILEHAGR